MRCTFHRACICALLIFLQCFSFLYKLNCFFSFDEVKDYLQQHLVAVERSNILEETDKTELYLLYINCLEVHMNSDSIQYLNCFTCLGE